MRWTGVLRTELALARAQVWTSGRSGTRLRGGAGGIVLAVLLVSFLTWTFAQAFAALASAGVPQDTAVRVFAWVLQISLIGMLVLDLQLSVTRVVAAADLELLRRAPLAPHEVLAIELMRALPQSSSMLVTFTLPAWLGLVRAYPALATHSLALLPVLALLWAIALGGGMALALALLRVTPAARLREALGLLATLLVTLSWLANSFLLPRVDRERGLDAMLAGALHTLPPPPAWSPARWGAEALAGPDADRAWGALLLAALAAGALAWGAASRWLGDVQSRASAGARRVARARAFERARSLTAAFLRRDAALLARDWTMMIDIVTASVLWALLPLVLAPALEMPAGALARSMLVLLATGLGYEVAARALPLERHMIVWAALSPIGARTWVLRRLVGVLLCSLPVMAIAGAALAVLLRPTPEAMTHAALLGLGAWLLASGVGLASGAIAGDPDWTHPRAMLGSAGRLVASLTAVLQAGGWSALGWAIEGPGLVAESAAMLLGLAGGWVGVEIAMRSVRQHITPSR